MSAKYISQKRKVRVAGKIECQINMKRSSLLYWMHFRTQIIAWISHAATTSPISNLVTIETQGRAFKSCKRMVQKWTNENPQGYKQGDGKAMKGPRQIEDTLTQLVKHLIMNITPSYRNIQQSNFLRQLGSKQWNITRLNMNFPSLWLQWKQWRPLEKEKERTLPIYSTLQNSKEMC